MSGEDRPFAFQEAPNTAVFTCTHILAEGLPILRVTHDADGSWQFLCGSDHGNEASAAEDGRIVCLKDIVDRDASVNDLAKMGPSHAATRDSATSPWHVEDHQLDDIRATIEEHGVWVGAIEADDERASFAYTIGLYANHKHPEIIMFGLPIGTMHALLNQCADDVRDGTRFSSMHDVSGIVKGYAVRFRAVKSEESHAEYLGLGCRFYESRSFPVLQCVWPDKAGRFPGEPGAADFMAKGQPLIA